MELMQEMIMMRCRRCR